MRLDVINGTADVQLCFDERLVEAEQRILVSHHAISVPGHVKLERMQSVYIYTNHNPATADHVNVGTIFLFCALANSAHSSDSVSWWAWPSR